jgi:mono/diheme cytochrome c family protein
LALAGCHIDMWVQSKPKSQDLNAFFVDTSQNPSSTRNPIKGTVEYKTDRTDTAFYTGYVNDKLVKEFPIPVTKQLIERGKERFTIFCTPCHGQLGDGNGMIAHRGFALQRPPASYHTERLRQMPVGHFFDVMTHGYGAMYPFAARISTKDRWAIAAYIRALQLSQHAAPGDLDEATRRQLGVTEAANTGMMFNTPEPAKPVPPAQQGQVDPSAAKPVANQPVSGDTPASDVPQKPVAATPEPTPAAGGKK